MFKRKFPMAAELSASATSANHRHNAWQMLDKARLLQIKEGNSGNVVKQIEKLLAYMISNLLPPITKRFESDVAEVAALLRDFKNFSHILCSDASFCCAVLRHSLKEYKLPVTRANSWRPIAKQLSVVVMAA